MHYGARDLKVADKESIQSFVESAPRYPTLLMREPARCFDQFGGWWFGALAAGTELTALACVEGHATNIYGTEPESITAMANEFLRRVRSMGDRKGIMHQLMGDADQIATFWNAFKTVPRKLVYDRQRDLVGSDKLLEPLKPGITVDVASEDDFKLVYEFTAEQAIEKWSVDPRKSAPKAHEERCRSAIEQARQLIANERGKPVLLCEVTWPEGEGKSAMLDRIFVSKPFRVRKKLVASALISTTNSVLEKAEEVLFFADRDDALLTRSVELAGYIMRHHYRLIAMRS